MVKRPFASDVRCRETRVSTDVATTTAPARGWLSGPVTLRVMISVVAPTWAAAERQATAAVKRVSATRRAVTTGAPFTVSSSGSRRTPPCWGRRRPPPGTGSGQALPPPGAACSRVDSASRTRTLLRLGAHGHPHNPSPAAGRSILGFIEDDDQQTIPLKVRARDQGRDVRLEPLVR